MKILNVVSHWSGSRHDACIWDNSKVAADFEDGQYDGLLVGDSGYALSKHLMAPVFRPHTGAESRYNGAHITTRCVIEREFGVWKKRFQILTKTMRFKPNKCGKVIVVATVLHNFGIGVTDVFHPDAVEVNDIEQYSFEPEADAARQAVRRSDILKYFN
ncbi:putative nuclease HARBI1 [Schistocerca piceifrons]|uniref:putative nuclease HARBI1 n=1 Tax=Schistocerca piceifrons TaxID=274613 RepID=UPI001F5EE966|nr:putative nuclease HARBI1 [Schistocerca piceifrons]